MRAGPGRAAGLGGDFAKLWTASAVSNLGDGVTRVAAPLLMASLTGDPALVAGAVLAQQLPWLLSLPSGAYADRWDRRRLLVAVNLLRGAALAGLAVTVWSGAVSVPVVYAALFLLGVGGTMADNAAFALLPAIVPAAGLTRANARLMAGDRSGPGCSWSRRRCRSASTPPAGCAGCGASAPCGCWPSASA